MTEGTFFNFEYLNEEYEVELHIDYDYTEGCKGNYHGLPEDCYPEEYPSINFDENDITVISTDKEDIEAFNKYELTDDDLETIETSIWEDLTE